MKNKQTHGILHTDGTLEVESNDSQLKITLSRVKILQEEKQCEIFRSAYYVKEGFEWQRTIESANYKTVDEFIEAISHSDEFTEAIHDIEKQKRGEWTCG